MQVEIFPVHRRSFIDSDFSRRINLLKDRPKKVVSIADEECDEELDEALPASKRPHRSRVDNNDDPRSQALFHSFICHL